MCRHHVLPLLMLHLWLSHPKHLCQFAPKAEVIYVTNIVLDRIWNWQSFNQVLARLDLLPVFIFYHFIFHSCFLVSFHIYCNIRSYIVYGRYMLCGNWSLNKHSQWIAKYGKSWNLIEIEIGYSGCSRCSRCDYFLYFIYQNDWNFDATIMKIEVKRDRIKKIIW